MGDGGCVEAVTAHLTARAMEGSGICRLRWLLSTRRAITSGLAFGMLRPLTRALSGGE